MSSYLFESAARAELILEVGTNVGFREEGSEKAKNVAEAWLIYASFYVFGSAKGKENQR
jgi:hypothetical protein